MQTRQLGMSLLLWLKSGGILERVNAPPETSSLLALQTCLMDGTLLCCLCQALSPTPTSYGEFYWHTEPHTHTQRISNARKAVERFSCLSGVGRRFLNPSVPAAVVAGDWSVIMGLLEDLHRFDDRQPGRPLVREDWEQPYLRLCMEPSHNSWAGAGTTQQLPTTASPSVQDIVPSKDCSSSSALKSGFVRSI